MNGKHYVGKKAQSFEQYEDVVIEGVLVQNKDGVQFKAGNQDGYVLDINCPYGNQQMADDLFSMVGGKTYRGYRAVNAILDPHAELGDGITINGVYSMLAYRRVNFGPNHASEIAAPGESTLNHEYNYINPTQREIDKNKENLETFAKNFTEYLDLIKKQTDQKAETWYQADDPSTDWNDEQKEEHSGDIWYNTSDGNFYIYEDKQWKKSPTTPPDYVFDQIDKKAEIYVTQPVPPYNENDLWFGGLDEPIRVCVQSRTAEEEFNMDDWQKKDEYIDKSDAEQAGKDAVDRQTQEDIFNKLTNDGQAQGIFKDENGDIYINVEYLRGDTIDLERLMLSGKLGGIKEGYGSTKTGRTTKGLLIWGPNGLNGEGNAIPPYMLLTDAGWRVQTTEDANFNVAGNTAEMQGNISATGNITAGGYVNVKGSDVYVGGNIAVNWNADANLMTYGSDYRSYFAGKQAYLGGDYAGYETYLRGENIYSSKTIQYNSDQTLKKDIEPMTEAYGRVLDRMNPVRYRYKTEQDDAPVHLGYIAQDVESAMEEEGIDNSALVGQYTDEEGNVRMALAYDELIPMLHMAIKGLEKRISDLEEVTSNG